MSKLATVRRHGVDNTWRSQRWQDAMKPDTGRESWVLPAFDALVASFPLKYCRGKTRMVQLHGGEKNWRYVIFFDRTYERDRQTDTAWRHTPRLCMAYRAAKIGHIYINRIKAKVYKYFDVACCRARTYRESFVGLWYDVTFCFLVFFLILKLSDICH